MKLSRLFSLILLGATPVALAVVTACNTTTFVDVPFDGGTDASAGPDLDGAVVPDSATSDAATTSDADDAASPDGKCHPISSAGMSKATYVPPTGANQGLCTDQQIQAYVDCRNGKTSACGELADGGATCKSCIETDRNAAAWGPIVIGGGSLELNEAGCGALANKDTTTMGCGQGLADYTECLQYTCGSQCIGSEYFDCATEARGTECKSIVTSLKATCTADVSACFAQKSDTADSLSLRLIKRFCGSP